MKQAFWRRMWEKSPNRLAFEDYEPGREHDYRIPRYAARLYSARH